MKILFFSPHAHTTAHSLPEAIVIEALKERGHYVVTVNCNGVLSSYCISMSAVGLSPQSSKAEKEAICEACRKRRDLIRKEFGFPSIILDKFIGKDEEQAIQEIILNVRQENYTELTWMNIPIGRYALYEFLINNKLISLNLNSNEWEEYKIFLCNALRVALAGRKILEEIKPDVIATYNSLYSVNHIFCALAEQREIPHYTLHAGSHLKCRLSTMTIFKGLVASVLITRHKSWKELSDMPISESQVQVVAEHIEELLKAESPWVYSVVSKRTSPESLRKFFGIKNDKHVLLATMACADERFAGATIDAMPPFIEPMFPTQIEWINALIKFVKTRDDLFLIIRVHPREFPNKREKVLSKNAMELQKLFVELPDNVRVNWPKDEISLHDLIKITDVGLNATSTTGIELGIFGVPVVLYDSNQLFSYPPEINYVAADPDDYYHKIEMALEDGWSFENVRKVFRWLSYKFEHVDIDISDGFGKTAKPSFFDRVYNRLLRIFHRNSRFEAKLEARRLIGPKRNQAIPVKNSELLCVAIEKNLESHLDLLSVKQQIPQSLEEETKAICDQVRKYVQIIQLSDDSPDEFTHKIERVLSG